MITWQEKLDAVLRSWQGTPFSSGQCCRGRAVDCRYFVVGVLDELHGTTAPLPRRMPPDTATHNRPGAVAALREMIDRWPSKNLDVKRDALEPGDVVIVRPPRSHRDTLKHAMIVGLNGTVWHASMAGVGYSVLDGRVVAHAFRPLGKERWGG